jgi:hypothetical protein
METLKCLNNQTGGIGKIGFSSVHSRFAWICEGNADVKLSLHYFITQYITF